MSFEITTARVKQYEANIRMLSQQKGSRLRKAVDVDTQVGIHGFVDQIGPTVARVKTTRHADLEFTSTPHARRRVTLVPYYWTDFLDDSDKPTVLTDPTGKYAVGGGWSMGRAMDDALIAAALGTAYTGETGSTSTVLPSTQKVAEASNTGLTVAKLTEAKGKFLANDVDEDIPLWMAIGAKQVENLLGETKFGSSDYNRLQPLVDGVATFYMGFNFINSQRLPVDADDLRSCIAWAQDGLALRIGTDIVIKIEWNGTKGAKQVYVQMNIGATRIEEVKVVKVTCDETPD